MDCDGDSGCDDLVLEVTLIMDSLEKEKKVAKRGKVAGKRKKPEDGRG